MKTTPTRAGIGSFVLLCFLLSRGAKAETLPIDPVAQETPVWCWVAVSEMVFRYYGLPNVNPAGDFQCGIVGTLGGSCASDCTTCIFPAGQLENLVMVLQGYPDVARAYVDEGARDVVATGVFRPLTAAEVVTEIDAGRPLIAGITPGPSPTSYGPAHVAVVVGYDLGATVDDPIVIVNDPFPFTAPEFGGQGDPYLAAGAQATRPGQYALPYSTFLTSLRWEQSVTDIRAVEVGGGQTDLPQYCCTASGALGPYFNNSVPEGGACFGTSASGAIENGTACFNGDEGEAALPQFCCTDAGALGPYEHDSILEGQPCFGTDADGFQHFGSACFEGPAPLPPFDQSCDEGCATTGGGPIAWSMVFLSLLKRRRQRVVA